MYFKFIVLAMVVFLTTATLAQTWERIYTDNTLNYCGRSITVTTDNNFVVCGTANLLESHNALAVKVNATTGNAIWTKVLPGFRGENALKKIRATQDGGTVMVGETSYYIPPSIYFPCGWVLKLNSAGDTVWSSLLNYVGGFTDIQETADSGFIVTGTRYGNRITVLRYNSRGDTIWTKCYSEPNPNGAQGEVVKILPNGGYLILGRIGLYNTQTIPPQAILIWLNNNGDTIRTKLINYWSNQQFQAYFYLLELTTDNGFVLGSYSTQIDSTGRTYYPSQIVKFNSIGDTLWSKLYYGSNSEKLIEDMRVTPSGIIITGTEYVRWGTGATYGAIIMKINFVGDSLWQRTYGGTANRQAGFYGIEPVDNGYVLTGFHMTPDTFFSKLLISRVNQEGDIAFNRPFSPSIWLTINYNNIIVNWLPVDNALGYKIYRSAVSGYFVPSDDNLIGTVGNVNSYIDAGIISSTTRQYYKVIALN